MTEIDQALQPFPGIPEALAALRDRGVRMAVVTTKHAYLAHRHLRSLRLAKFFSAIITGDQCQRCKPDPLPLHLALSALKVRPEEAVAVGDTPGDVAAAKAAGVLAAAATWGAADPAALLSAGPDRVLTDPAQLLALDLLDNA